VSPAHRRKGLARRLTEAAIAWAREHGCTLVRLSASEPAETLYRSLGFTRGRELVLRLDSDLAQGSDRVAERGE
ncbi:MAG: GNAT family N-acetyltransferase, partial [Candidatus Eremiobacteraeota bacterium]|nr:GNAT family N-acetyltransferase [Candidatus Eremiobacteraeota bacterium]